jgi:enamine deaminase RidA (YjgF/YER057c/UK114 family)
VTKRRSILSGSAFEEQIGYARAVIDGDWVHVSGTTGFDYPAMTISPDVTEQARQALSNIGTALGEAGCTFADVATCSPTAATSSRAGRCCGPASARSGPQPR